MEAVCSTTKMSIQCFGQLTNCTEESGAVFLRAVNSIGLQALVFHLSKGDGFFMSRSQSWISLILHDSLSFLYTQCKYCPRPRFSSIIMYMYECVESSVYRKPVNSALSSSEIAEEHQSPVSSQFLAAVALVHICLKSTYIWPRWFCWWNVGWSA